MIELTIQKSFGSIRISAENERALFGKAEFWTEIPDRCPKCDSLLFLRHRRAANKFDYYELVCKGPTPHICDCGQFKDGTGLYYKGEWVNKFGTPSPADEAKPRSAKSDDRVSPETKGRLLVEGGYVSKVGKGYDVVDAKTGEVSEVRRSAAKGIYCNCDDFANSDEKKDCAHIVAVRIFSATV